MTTTARPLDDVRVLELDRYQAGPRGGMVLSDLGAEVIKIEPRRVARRRARIRRWSGVRASTSPSTTVARKASASI